MSEFMESELIQKEMRNIADLQQDIFQDSMRFESLDKESKLAHIDKLQQLLEMQKVMYTRLSLSDDPEAIVRKENIQKFCNLLGFGGAADVNKVFTEMDTAISSMREQLDT
tara:strand:- start:3 stop:335 length:333 start_codon:yes stop_codon:yes gene_type:complete